MKVEAKEVEKINRALQSISGWEVDRFDLWESASGDLMATIRLRQLRISHNLSGTEGAATSISTELK